MSTALRYPQKFDLTGTQAVVTGGESGISLESARALAQCGARPILLDRDPAALERAQQALRDENGSTPPSVST